ncbi:N-lysine methyltransferase SETD6-like [Dendronephthya gigantea]|uniref:N-lysine methyltransferase SETD6-like n=1 Tax=Dendronephthya gigantea TaxID=151771 RepID=UPI00106B6B82|nr:N-lysine methyltransferase SETD6-like [Dendronephthya gigantea]
MADPPQQKRRRVENPKTQCLVENFLQWCGDVGLTLNSKVTVREEGSCHRFGMIALENIEEGESVFKIPRNVLLEPHTSAISGIVSEFAECLPEIHSRNKWLPLLITLLHEYTNPTSKWRPYLDLVPSETVLNQPIFWTEQERKILTSIDLKDGVEEDERNIELGYKNFVLPFMEKNKKYFDPKVHTLDLYKRLAGFVMAYSFTDSDDVDAKPAMVPMADILNHVSDNNAHLEFGDEFLSMVTTQAIRKGCEVFNTYGNLDNCNLLRSYGFIEDPPNVFDEVDIPLRIFQEVLKLSDKEWRIKMTSIRGQQTCSVNTEEGLIFNLNAGCTSSGEELHTLFEAIHERQSKSDENDEIRKDIERNEIENDNDNNTNLEYIKPKSNVDKGLTEISGDVSKHAGITVDDDEDDGLKSDSDEASEGDKGTTMDTSGSDSDGIGDFWGNDGSESDDSSCAGQSGVGWVELQELPGKWKQTMTRAASVRSRNIQNLAEELSRKVAKSQDKTRITMVKNILQGQLTILRKIQDLSII